MGETARGGREFQPLHEQNTEPKEALERGGEEPKRPTTIFFPRLVINFPTQSLSEWDEGQNHRFITQHQALKWVTVGEGNRASGEEINTAAAFLFFSLSSF